MNTMLENYINGNLTDAKRQAKRFSEHKIYNALREIGYSECKANLTAAYLKGASHLWQQACDAE